MCMNFVVQFLRFENTGTAAIFHFLLVLLKHIPLIAKSEKMIIFTFFQGCMFHDEV